MKLLLAPLALFALAGAQEAPAPTGVAGTLLIGNKGEDSLSFVDLVSGQELGRAATGRMPHEIAVSPDGRRAAVVAYGARGIDIFDVATRARLRTIDLSPNEGPHGIAWLSDGRILATTERSQSLTIIDTRNGDAVSAVPTGQDTTHMVAVSPDARLAYTANIRSGTVSIIDLASGTKLRDIAVGGAPEAIALAPDGRTLWVGDNEGARVHAFDTVALTGSGAGFAPVINISYEVADSDEDEVRRTVTGPLEQAMRGWTGASAVRSHVAGDGGWTEATLAPGSALPPVEEVMTRVRAAAGSFPRGRTEIAPRLLSAAPLATIPTGAVPIRALASPDGRWVVTSNAGDGTLTVIDAADRTVARTISVSGTGEAAQVTILFSADGQRLYAAETARNQVAEIDLASGRVLRRLPAGANGDGLAIAP